MREQDAALEERPQSQHQEKSRKDFLKTAALLGGTAFFSRNFRLLDRLFDLAQAYSETQTSEYPFLKPENMIYSSCQQCNTSPSEDTSQLVARSGIRVLSLHRVGDKGFVAVLNRNKRP